MFQQRFRLHLIALPVLLTLGAYTHAQQVRFDKEELSTETVLPVVSNPSVVRQKNIPLANRIELDLGYGLNFTEPVYSQGKMLVGLGYHWSEQSGLVAQYTQWASGRNAQYASQLEGPGIGLKLNRIPDLQSTIFLNYEHRAFYGKISLSKQSVMNLSIYPIFGLGTIKYSHKNYYGANAGIGWKFYFSKMFALRTDFYFQYAGGINPFSPGDKLATTENTVTPADFTDRWKLGTHFDVSLGVLF